jgi:cytochrome c-type biogenesis protein CcmH
MMFWLILAVMTAAALGAVIWPLARARALAPAGSDLAVYRDQLEEIERDHADGRIGDNEFEAARVEVSRRLLAAADKGAAPAAASSDAISGDRRFAALVSACVAIPLFAAIIYGARGSPELPGQPFASRQAAIREQAGNFAAMVARVEAHLDEEPGDGRGWEVLAPVYMRLDRYDDAVKARRNALRLLGETAIRHVDLGEALTAAAGGTVTAEAKAAFERAVAIDANSFKAIFYLGLAAQQDGRNADAAGLWRGLIAKAPPDAPWLAVVRESLERVEGEESVAAAPAIVPPAGAAPRQAAAAAPGPSAQDVAAASDMSASERNQMIRGMVDRLAARLHEDGTDLDGWLRLLRAYMVLGDRDKAKTAAGEARTALSGDPEKLRRLDAVIRELGVEG